MIGDPEAHAVIWGLHTHLIFTGAVMDSTVAHPSIQPGRSRPSVYPGTSDTSSYTMTSSTVLGGDFAVLVVLIEG